MKNMSRDTYDGERFEAINKQLSNSFKPIFGARYFILPDWSEDTSRICAIF